jgi:hypothetical protein
MTATVTASSDANPASEQFQAAALWTFVHLKTPRFTSEAALDVVRHLMPISGEDPKHLAKRLRTALLGHGIALKHVNALDAAARLLGHVNWHAAQRILPAVTLKLVPMADSGEEVFADWRQLASRLCEWCDAWLQEKGTRVFEVRFGPAYVMVCVPTPKEGGPAGSMDEVPLLVVNPVGEAEHWLQDAPAAFETLRRHLEESGKAVLDGVAVLQLCNQYSKDVLERLPAIPQPVRPTDACNSELLLLREDDELLPGSGYEIARGDEMTCWSQLELAMKDHQSAEITLDDGAWRIGGGRYVWQLSTIHPKDFVPGLVITMLSESDSEKLLRRYKLVKRVFSNRLRHHEVTKRLKYLNGPSDTYRIDLHKLLLLLDKAGLTWNGFCQEIDDQREMVPELPVGFVMSLVDRLKLKDPNSLFALPSRSELARADDDSLLRTLLPRIDIVRYRLVRRVSDEVKQTVREAIEEFGTSIRMQALTAAGQLTNPDDPLPYLVYASDAEELRLKLETEGLVMYAGVMPHLFLTEGVIEKMPNVAPYAFGHSLYLDIDFAEGGAQ